VTTDEAFGQLIAAASALALSLEYYDKNPGDDSSYRDIKNRFDSWDRAMSAWIDTLSSDDKTSSSIASLARLDPSLVARVLKATARYVEGFLDDK
jgi:hypothetical protein